MDNELFNEAMEGVTRRTSKPKVSLRKARSSSQSPEMLAQKRLSAETEVVHNDPNHLQVSEVEQVGAHDVLGYKRPGIQDGVFRKLRLGKYDIEARLDLHRKTVEQARADVFRFVNDCIAHDLRTVMVLPGKGDRNPDQPATLKSYLVHWLTELDQVQGFHTAQPQHGGAGAFYVLLRKSERKKQDARERFSHGRL